MTQWRYTCPEGHTKWEYKPNAGHYYCEMCRRNGDDPFFDRKIDKKTGEAVA